MEKGTVLVVDDDPTLIEVLRLLLEEEGYRVLIATGATAPATARAEQPGVDGVALGRGLREDPATGHIPIVCVSAGLARGIREGMIADEWLAKPFDIHRLYDVVARWLARPAAPGASRASPVPG